MLQKAECLMQFSNFTRCSFIFSKKQRVCDWLCSDPLQPSGNVCICAYYFTFLLSLILTDGLRNFRDLFCFFQKYLLCKGAGV